jgi:hypothetical protein
MSLFYPLMWKKGILKSSLSSGHHLRMVYPGSLTARIGSPDNLPPELPAKNRDFLHIFSENALSARFTANGAISFELQNANGRFWKAEPRPDRPSGFAPVFLPGEHRHVRLFTG